MLFPILFAAGIFAADLISKYLVVQFIPLGCQLPLIPGIVHLTYVRNTGAAFSLLAGNTWLFTAVTIAFLGFIFLALRKKWLATTAEKWICAAVCAGALGNLADRLFRGYVVDMIEVEFIDFAVFNVADCFITCGAIALALCVLLEDRKKEKPNASDL